MHWLLPPKDQPRAKGIIMESTRTPERNATFTRFGGMDTLIADYRWWSVQIRPQQATLGAIILLAHGPALAFGDLPDGAHTELARITHDIETAVRRFGNQKINYLMLMMVDPHVHFHVVPRYAASVVFDDITFTDSGWPGLPDLACAPTAPDAAARVCAALCKTWPTPAD
jgi:diadenosine tetraphosphate (Ap4A) HIT family hydrolase